MSVTTSTSAAAGGTVAASGTSDPLASLTSNFQSFLSMLTTQLQNQDPTAPMDSSQFTTELVQFTGVEAQIQTNSSLTQLIQLAQGSTMLQSAQLLGKQVDVSSSQLALQNGSAAIDFTAPAAGPVAVAVFDSAGTQIYNATVTATQGSNRWTWNGKAADGVTQPDGAYTVSVTTAASGSSATALPFTVAGTVTGVQQQGSSVQLDLGKLAVGVSAVTSVQN